MSVCGTLEGGEGAAIPPLLGLVCRGVARRWFQVVWVFGGGCGQSGARMWDGDGDTVQCLLDLVCGCGVGCYVGEAFGPFLARVVDGLEEVKLGAPRLIVAGFWMLFKIYIFYSGRDPRDP
jgi:hypothetical protein